MELENYTVNEQVWGTISDYYYEEDADEPEFGEGVFVKDKLGDIHEVLNLYESEEGWVYECEQVDTSEIWEFYEHEISAV